MLNIDGVLSVLERVLDIVIVENVIVKNIIVIFIMVTCAIGVLGLGLVIDVKASSGFVLIV